MISETEAFTTEEVMVTVEERVVAGAETQEAERVVTEVCLVSKPLNSPPDDVLSSAMLHFLRVPELSQTTPPTGDQICSKG